MAEIADVGPASNACIHVCVRKAALKKSFSGDTARILASDLCPGYIRANAGGDTVSGLELSHASPAAHCSSCVDEQGQ